MNLNITPRLAAVLVGLMICYSTSWATTSDYSRTTEITSNCDLNFTTELIGIFCNEDRGNIVVNITGGTAPFTIEWDNRDFSIWAEVEIDGDSFTITGLPADFYKIQVRDAFGCIQKQDVQLRDQVSTMDLTVTNNSSACDMEGSIAVVVGNSSPPYWVTLDGPTPQGHIINDNVFTLDGLAGGEYIVRVRQDECDATSIIKVITNTSPLELQLKEVASCPGGFVAVATNIIGGHPNYKLYYDGPTSGSVLSNGPKLVQNLLPGIYVFTVVDQEGCTVSQELEVKGINSDIGFDSDVNQAQCGRRGFVRVYGMRGIAPYQLSWSGPRSNAIIIANATSYDIMDLPAGDYELTMSDANGCTFRSNVRMNANQSTVSLTTDVAADLCTQTGRIWVSPMGGTGNYTLSWTGPTQGSVAIGTSGFSIPNLPSGVYQITVTDENGCSATQETAFNITTTPVSLNIDVTTDFCTETGRIWVSPVGGTGNYTLSWTGPTQGSVAIDTSGFSIANLPSGVYQITITDQNGCSATQEAAFTINIATPPVSFTSDVAANPCNQTGAIWVSPMGGTGNYTLSWTGPTQGSVTDIGTSGFSIPGLPSGRYSLTLTDQNGCSATGVEEFNLINPSVSLITDVTTNLCNQTGSIWVSPSGGTGIYTLSWTGPTQGSVGIGTDGFSIADLPSGVYQVVVTDQNGCSASEEVEFNITTPFLRFDLSSSNAFNGKNGSISVAFENGQEPYTVSWTGPVSNFIRANGPSVNIPNLPAGTYSITVTDSNGCFNAQQITVANTAINTNLNFSAEPSDQIGSVGGSIRVLILEGNGPYTISWTGPASGTIRTDNIENFIRNLSAGTYTITVTDRDGNFGTQIVEVGFQEDRSFAINVGVTNSICELDGSINASWSNGVAPYQVSWTGSSSGSLTTKITSADVSLPAGSYIVTITDAKGESLSAVANIGVDTSTLFCSLDPMNAICTSNGSLFVVINGGTLPYQLRWEGPSSGAVTVRGNFTIPNLSPGTYSTFLTDATGCEIMESAVIGISPSNLGVTINGGKGTIDFLFGSGTPNYNITLSGPSTTSRIVAGNTTFTGLPEGLYRATIVDANGCTMSQLVRVTGNDVVSEEPQLVSNLTSNQATINEKSIEELEELEDNPVFTLRQNFPNPSTSFTTIPFNLLEEMEVRMTIQDRFGKIVKEVHQTFEAGYNQIEISGNELSTGIYYYTLIVGAEMQTKRMMITE